MGRGIFQKLGNLRKNGSQIRSVGIREKTTMGRKLRNFAFINPNDTFLRLLRQDMLNNFCKFYFIILNKLSKTFEHS
jgi:hypothetical protein